MKQTDAPFLSPPVLMHGITFCRLWQKFIPGKFHISKSTKPKVTNFCQDMNLWYPFYSSRSQGSHQGPTIEVKGLHCSTSAWCSRYLAGGTSMSSCFIQIYYSLHIIVDKKLKKNATWCWQWALPVTAIIPYSFADENFLRVFSII